MSHFHDAGDGPQEILAKVRGQMVHLGDRVFHSRWLDGNRLLLAEGDRRFHLHAARDGDHLWVQWEGQVLRLQLVDPDEAIDSGSGSPVVRAPMPGKVLAVLVAAGDSVVAGQAVLRVEAMKMEVELHVQIDGVVASIHCEEGELVNPERDLLRLELPDEE